MTNDQTVTQALEPCPFCRGEARLFTIGENEPENAGGDVISCTKCGASSHVEFGRKENLVDRWNTRTAHSGEGREHDKPPSHWTANDKCDRHPQSTEEWDWHADSPSEDSCERSIKRLNFAVDRGDPDAPNQMALVLRVDLSRVLGRLVHYTAHRELLMQKQAGEGRSNGAGEIDAGLVERFRSALRFAASRSVISSADEQALLAALSTPQGEMERLRAAMKQAEIHIDCASFRKAQDILRAALAQPEAGGER